MCFQNITRKIRTNNGLLSLTDNNVNQELAPWFQVSSGMKHLYYFRCINDLAENINELGCGVKFNEETISILLYADDIALITPDQTWGQLLSNVID